MLTTLHRVATILLATGIILIGHGLQISLLPVYARNADWSASSIGYIGSSYFLGFVVGCIRNPRVVASVGHIRSFTVMASLACTALLAAGLIVHVFAWILLRFAFGFAMAGMYMVIESWLSSITPRSQRSRVLAVYTMICLLGIALGQSLMALETEPSLMLFMVAAMFTALSIIPVGLTQISTPEPVPAVEFSPRALLRASEVALVVSALAGMATGVYWSLGPLLGQSLGMTSGQVGLFIGVGVLGGALVQIPVGYFADRVDRRRIIAITACAGLLFAVVAMFAVGSGTPSVFLFVGMFATGAAIMPLYALCIGHANDYSDLSLVEITSSVLVVNGIGSIFGPIFAGLVMQWFGAGAFFAYIAVVLAAIAGWAIYRQFVVERKPHTAEATPVLPRTTQAVADLSTVTTEMRGVDSDDKRP